MPTKNEAKEIDSLEAAEKKLSDLETKLSKTREVLGHIASVPKEVKVTVRPGGITFKLEDENVSFKDLVEDIKKKFRVKLDKEFNENNGRYFLQAVIDDTVKLKIQGIPAPMGCEIRMREVEVVQRKKQFLPFGTCEAIVR